MQFIIAAALVALLILFGDKALKRHPYVFYGAAVACMAATLYLNRRDVPAWLGDYIMPLFSRGMLAGALWMAVMWAGALPNGSKSIKKIMPIRGELSILAALMTIAHDIIYGNNYIVRLFTAPQDMPTHYLVMAILSICMLVIMIPLTVLSFPRIRRRMNGRRWKRIQRAAYGFYALLYAHVILVLAGGALRHRLGNMISIIVYTVIFSAYTFCRIRKWYRKAHKITGARYFSSSLALTCVCAVLALALPLQLGTRGITAAFSTSAVAAESAQADAASSDETEADGDLVTLTGSAFGYDDDIVATVTVDADGTIVAISAVTYEEDPSYFNRVRSSVTAAILDKQSTDISEVVDMDAVSGATTSAKALAHAVENAISGKGVQLSYDDEDDE